MELDKDALAKLIKEERLKLAEDKNIRRKPYRRDSGPETMTWTLNFWSRRRSK